MTMTEQLTLMPQQRPDVKVINFLLRHARWRKAWVIFHANALPHLVSPSLIVVQNNKA
jgi:hypothetical protein